VPATRIVATALCLALVAACGGDDGPDASDDTAPVADAAPAAAELDAALLTPADLDTGNDLDAGWELGDVSEGVEIDLPACITEEADGDAAATAETKLVTRNDLKLPSLEEYLAAYEDDGAAAAFDAAAARLDACAPEFVYEGTPSLGTTERLPLALDGEPAAAWRTTVTIAGAGVAITNVHAVQGDVVLTLVHVDLGTPDAALLESYARKALAKLA
jgi:hypothetical protein